MRKLLAITALLLVSVSCDNETDPSPTGVTTTITMTAAGVSPKTVTINAGDTITWVNNDTVQHQPSSNPHPQHTDCPGLNVNPINPGQQAMSAPVTTRRACGFHDHLADTNANFQGTVTVQ
jgi:plastocyanin